MHVYTDAMDNNFLTSNIGPIIGAAGVITGALIGKGIQKNNRDNIKRDLEIYHLLPRTASSRQALLRRTDENVQHFLVAGWRVGYDYTFPAMGLFALIMLVAGLPLANQYGVIKNPWEYLILGFSMIVTLVIATILTLTDSIKKQLRNENGIPMKKNQK